MAIFNIELNVDNNKKNMIKDMFKYSIILTGLVLIIVGYFEGLVTGKHKIKSAIQTFLIGGIAAGLAFGSGYLLSSLIA